MVPDVGPATRHEEAVELAIAAAAEYTVGDPMDESTRIGPVVSEAQRRRVAGYIERGISDGATVAIGGPGTVAGLESGAYVQPTVFSNVNPNAVIAQEEIFGPVLSVIAYADDEQAVQIANATVYGLNAAVFGEREHALAVAKRLRAGQVDVNGAQFNPLAPFGGTSSRATAGRWAASASRSSWRSSPSSDERRVRTDPHRVEGRGPARRRAPSSGTVDQWP